MDEKIDLTENRMFRDNPFSDFFDEDKIDTPCYDEELLEVFCGKDRCLFYGTDRGQWRRLGLSYFDLKGSDSGEDYHYDHALEEFSENKFKEDEQQMNLVRIAAYIKFWNTRYKSLSELVSSERETPSAKNKWENDEIYESFRELVSNRDLSLRNLLKANPLYLAQEPDQNQDVLVRPVYKMPSANDTRSTYFHISIGDVCGNDYKFNKAFIPVSERLSGWFRKFLTYRRDEKNRSIHSQIPGTFKGELNRCRYIKSLYDVIETDLDDHILERLRSEDDRLNIAPITRWNISTSSYTSIVSTEMHDQSESFNLVWYNEL